MTELTATQKKQNSLWLKVAQRKAATTPVVLAAQAVAELLRFAKVDQKRLRDELMAEPDAQEQRAAIAMTLADHWTCEAIEALEKANGKRQIQSYVLAFNRAVDFDREVAGA